MRRLAAVTVVLLGCGVPRGDLPAGVTCSRWAQASGDSALAQALSDASSGTCVVAQAGQYRQALSVPQGVSLVGEAGAMPEFSGGSDTQPVVTLGPNAVLAGLRVNASAAGIGVSGGGKGQRLHQVTVSGGTRAGVVFWCEEDCRADEAAQVSDTTITGAAVGLMTRGVRVKLKNGVVTKSGGASLTAGYGVVASGGAVLEAEGTVIEQNESLGVLVDGARDTEVSLARVTVRENKGRGVWAQGLAGTMEKPRLTLTDTTLERNVLVGLGARGSTGIKVTGGRIAGTQSGATTGPTPGQLVMVGDGLGAFENTGALRVEGASLEANQRSQALVDSAGAGIVLASSVTVNAGAGQGVVVQRSAQPVDAMNVTRPAAGMELSVSSPTLGVPTR